MMTKFKWTTTWLALVLGGLGAHRFYLHGVKDIWGWLHVPFTLAGIAGVVRAQNLGVDDKISWMLIPLGGFSLAAAMLAGIVYGLMDDEKWNARFNPTPNASAANAGWGAVLGVVACVFLGGSVLMASIVYSAQHFFEWQVEEAAKISQ
jgi:hypothetical protein